MTDTLIASGDDEPTGRRTPRRPSPVDTSVFDRDVDAALIAFGQDVSYACAMARSAVTIALKRKHWQARRDLRAA